MQLRLPVGPELNFIGSYEEDGEKVTIWVCACVKTKKPSAAG